MTEGSPLVLGSTEVLRVGGLLSPTVYPALLFRGGGSDFS